MFHADRWAAAFVGAQVTDAEAGLARLKDLACRLKPVSGAFFGSRAAEKLEKLLRENLAGEAGGGAGTELEFSIRFICLLVEKNLFRKIDLIIARIEKKLNDANGVLEVIAETAAPADGAFEKELSEMIRARTGAPRIKMNTRVVPELLAGYRLRMDGLCVDASLKGQLEQMAADLTVDGQAAAES